MDGCAVTQQPTVPCVTLQAERRVHCNHEPVGVVDLLRMTDPLASTLDSSHILTPVECERMLANALRRLDEATHDFKEIEFHAAEAEADYRKAKGYKAIAIIRSAEKWSAKERDARIELELDVERRAHLYAQAGLHSAREALVSLRLRIEALRSLAASVRSQT